MGLRGEMVLLAVQIAVDHKRDGQHNARTNTAEQHLAHRHTGDGRINDHGHTGRNDGRDTGGSRRGGRSEVAIHTGVLHGLDLQPTHAGDVGHGRAGAACKEHRRQHIHMSHTTGQMAHQRTGKIKDLLGNAGLGHRLTGQHKERNRQHREG